MAPRQQEEESSVRAPLLERRLASDAEIAPSPLPSLPPRSGQCKPLAVIPSSADGAATSFALCGEFLLAASPAGDIIVRQQPDLRCFTRFGAGGEAGAVKALAAHGAHVFSAHHDGRVRVWSVSRRSSENRFRLAATLPTARDYIGKFLHKSSYVQTRRSHRKLWIEHDDSISCLAVHGGFLYSGSWDKTIKVWWLSDFRCVQSVRAHDDAINALIVCSSGPGPKPVNGSECGFRTQTGNTSLSVLLSASADGTVKAWGIGDGNGLQLIAVLAARDGVSWNALAADPSGKSVYAAASDGIVSGWEWSPKNGEWMLAFDVRAHGMAVLCLCAVGDMVCTGSADKSVGVWKRRTGEGGGLVKVAAMTGHEGPVKSVQGCWYRTAKGYLVYSGGLDKTTRVWWVPLEEEGSF